MPTHSPYRRLHRLRRTGRGRSCTPSARSSARPVPTSRRRSNETCDVLACRPAARRDRPRSSGMPRSGSGSTAWSTAGLANGSARAVSAGSPRLEIGRHAVRRSATARSDGVGVKAAPAPCRARPPPQPQPPDDPLDTLHEVPAAFQASAQATGANTSRGCTRLSARRYAGSGIGPREAASRAAGTPQRLNAATRRRADSFSRRSGTVGQNGYSYASQRGCS